MALAAEPTAQPAIASYPAVRALRIAVAVALMLIAANCFLKYLWWTACYSAWSGIPKMAPQWRAAGAKSSLYGWTVIVLELASFVTLYTSLSLRQWRPSFVKTALRAVASISIVIIATGLLALALSWVKQSH